MSQADIPKNLGFMVSEGRRAKAMKILQVLAESSPRRTPPGTDRPKLLDIGTGNGEIASVLADDYEVTSVDVVDQRRVSGGFSFVRLEGELLPFEDRSFDVVVSNHVIEHVPDADRHLAEIARVMRDEGVVYLATPNRLWPWEVHYRVPLLHYLPAPWFMSLLKKFNRYHEDISLLGWMELQRRTRRDFTVTPFSDRMCKWPRRYHLDCPAAVAGMLARIPLRVFRLLAVVHPTLIVVMQRRSRRAGQG